MLGVNASSFRIRSYFTDEHALSFSIDGTGAPGSHWPGPRSGPLRPALTWEIGKRGERSRRRAALKRALGGLPYAGRAYQNSARPAGGPRRLASRARPAPGGSAGMAAGSRGRAGAHVRSETPRRLLVIGALSWWIEYSAAVGLLLSAAGHHVELATVPYRRWMAPAEAFDVDRQRALPHADACPALAPHSPA